MDSAGGHFWSWTISQGDTHTHTPRERERERERGGSLAYPDSFSLSLGFSDTTVKKALYYKPTCSVSKLRDVSEEDMFQMNPAPNKLSLTSLLFSIRC